MKHVSCFIDLQSTPVLELPNHSFCRCSGIVSGPSVIQKARVIVKSRLTYSCENEFTVAIGVE